MIHLDTCFVIDLARESREGGGGPAHEALGRVAEEALALSAFVLCELRTGVELTARGSVESTLLQTLTDGMEVVYPDQRFPRKYGELAAYLRRTGQPVATMDLLIATSAVVEGAALLTRDGGAFRRVPGLDVLGY